MVDYVNDVTELVRGFRRFAFGGDAPADIEDRLQRIPGTDADVITEGAEILYAYRDELNDEGLTVMAQLFNYAVQQGWTAFNQGDRSATIVENVSRALGERGAIQPPPPEEWPEPQANRRDGVDWRSPEGTPEEPPADEPAPTE